MLRYGILHIGRVGSVTSTLSVAMERFFAIKYPLIVHERAKTCIVLCIVFSVVYNIPRFFEFETIDQDISVESSLKLRSNESQKVKFFSF